MELTYEKNGDYLIPNLIPDSEPEEPLTRYGLMRKNYLKEHRRGMQAKGKLAEVFTQKSGEGFVDTALKILISVVVGALLLAGLYTLFKDTILPTLTQKITSLFNYQG